MTVPRVGAIRSATTLSSVLLPQPEGPTSETNAPSGMSSVIPDKRLDRLGAADAVDDIDIRHRNRSSAAVAGGGLACKLGSNARHVSASLS